MTEAQAQNKLGELFVDIGVGGLGKTLKALNSVSASFLLTKNAAQQALKPIVDMTKQGITLSTALDKIKASTGFDEDLTQKIKAWSHKNNVEFQGFIGSLENLQQEILDFQKGTSTNGAWATLGINPMELNYEKPLEALDLIQQRLKQLNEPARISAIKDLGGIGKDIAYIVQRINEPISKSINNIDKGLIMSKEQLAVLQKQQDHWNNIVVATDKIKNNIASMEVSEKFMSDIDKTLTLIATKGFVEGEAEAVEKFDKRNSEKQAEHRKAFKDWLIGTKYKPIMKAYANPRQRKEITDKVKETLAEEERKYWNQKNGKKEEKQNPIAKELSKTDSAQIPQESNTEILGAKQINVPEVKQVKVTQELTDDNLPPLPKEAPLTNNVKTVNINNTFTNNFDGVNASPSDIADEIAAQVAQYSTVEKENPLIN